MCNDVTTTASNVQVTEYYYAQYTTFISYQERCWNQGFASLGGQYDPWRFQYKNGPCRFEWLGGLRVEWYAIQVRITIAKL